MSSGDGETCKKKQVLVTTNETEPKFKKKLKFHSNYTFAFSFLANKNFSQLFYRQIFLDTDFWILKSLAIYWWYLGLCKSIEGYWKNRILSNWYPPYLYIWGKLWCQRFWTILIPSLEISYSTSREGIRNPISFLEF